MQQLFPLTEDIWLEWLSDEHSAARKPAEHTELHRLYKLAVEDYLSLAIWDRYLR